MKITRIAVYQKTLPYVGGRYTWGPGRVLEQADSTVIVIETDAGIQGSGECCPLGPNYLAAHADGVRAAVPRLAQAILGEDPRQVGRIELAMDEALKGHGYAKSAFDAACWDILGKALDQPLWMLLGGKLAPDGTPLYRVAPQKPPADMVAEMETFRAVGIRQFQVKVGADWVRDIERIRATVPTLKSGETAFADANTGWRVDHAVRVARATRDLDYYLEQPCLTYEECLQVRARSDLPMKLDECIVDLQAAERAVNDRAAEVICLKISRHGGLSKARRVRDYLAEHAQPMVVEDAWGGEIVTATLAHLAASTPQALLVNATDLHNYNSDRTGVGAPTVRDGRMFAPDRPGHGAEPDFESLADPIAVFGAERAR